MKKESREEILVTGLVQGVGFRYFIFRKALELGLKGYTKNLFTGEVLTVVEGSNYLIEDLFQQIQIGPSHAHVKDAKIEWSESKGEFKSFEVLY